MLWLLFHTLLRFAEASPTSGFRIHVLTQDSAQIVSATIIRGQRRLPLNCGDGQEFQFDGERDGIWTCEFKDGWKSPEYLEIALKDTNQTVFEGLVSMTNGKSTPSMAFQVRKKGSKWTATRIALHRNVHIENLMVTSREWVIGLWGLFVINILGWLLWFTKKS